MGFCLTRDAVCFLIAQVDELGNRIALLIGRTGTGLALSRENVDLCLTFSDQTVFKFELIDKRANCVGLGNSGLRAARPRASRFIGARPCWCELRRRES